MLKRIMKLLESPPDSGNGYQALQAGNRIDILALREDGGVDLIIKVRGRLDDSPLTQNLLEAKIRNYLEQRGSIAFRTEFRHATADQTCIVLETEDTLPRAIHALLQRLEPAVRAGQARLVIRGHQTRRHDRRSLYFPVLQRKTDGAPGQPSPLLAPDTGPPTSPRPDWLETQRLPPSGERPGDAGSAPGAV